MQTIYSFAAQQQGFRSSLPACLSIQHNSMVPATRNSTSVIYDNIANTEDSVLGLSSALCVRLKDTTGLALVTLLGLRSPFWYGFGMYQKALYTGGGRALVMNYYANHCVIRFTPNYINESQKFS